MITLIDNPSTIALTRNPIRYRLRATDPEGSPYGGGRGVEVRLEIQDYFEDGDTLIVNWTEPSGTTTSIIFTAKLIPSAIDEFQANDGFQPPVDEYINNVVGVIALHPQIAAFFTVAYQDNNPTFNILFIAKSLNADWVVDLDVSGVTPSVTVVQDLTVIPNSTPPNYRVQMEVFFEDTYMGSDYHQVASLRAAPDAFGFVFFEIQQIIHAEFETTRPSAPLPPYGSDTMLIADNLRRYFVRFTEEYGTPVEVQPWQYDDTRRALFGGISQQKWLTTDFFSILSRDNCWLSFYPDKKKITPDQPEWLKFYNYMPDTYQIFLKVEVFDATESGYKTIINPFSATKLELSQYETALIPVNYNALGLGDTGVADIVKYTVQVLGELDMQIYQLSDVLTFYVDYTTYKDQRYLMYLNSFGLPETLRTTGLLDKQLEVNREILSRSLAFADEYTSYENRQYAENFRNIYTFRSGYYSRAEVDALQELLIYNRAWDVSSVGVFGLLILTDKFQVTQTFQFLHSIEFDAVLSLSPRNYSTPAGATDYYLIGDPVLEEVLGDENIPEWIGFPE